MPPKNSKTKVGTKGSKQILSENQQTYDFYFRAIFVVFGLTLVFHLMSWYLYGLNWKFWLLIASAGIVYYCCLKTVKSMMKSSLDINASSGVAEYVKDILGLTLFCQTLSNFSVYFWILWLIIPIMAVVKLWTSVIAPWIFQEGPEELSQKQKRKMERKTFKRF